MQYSPQEMQENYLYVQMLKKWTMSVNGQIKYSDFVCSCVTAFKKKNKNRNGYSMASGHHIIFPRVTE